MIKNSLNSCQFIDMLRSHFLDVPLFQVLQKNLAVDPLHITQFGGDEDLGVTSICVYTQSVSHVL